MEHELDDDWGPENEDNLGFDDPEDFDFDSFDNEFIAEVEDLDSPTDSDEYVMNEDDCFEDLGDPCDPYDIEYDR